MNVQTETGSIACHYTAGFYYGAPAGGQSSSPSDSPQPLYPPPPSPRSHLCKDGSLPDYAPCGCNDKAVRVCVCVRLCAHTSLPIPHPRLYPTPHTFFFVFSFAHPKSPWQQPATKTRCIQKTSRHVSLWLLPPLFHSSTRCRAAAACVWRGSTSAGEFSLLSATDLPTQAVPFPLSVNYIAAAVGLLS